MIAKLWGLLDEVHQDKCIINVNGVGYLVFLSSKTADHLKKQEKNSPISLIIETLVKEDAFELYGFLSESEKNWFLELTKVQGVGNKMGQKILSAFEPNDLIQALLTKDSKAFSKVSGIGPKLANRIVTELKDAPNKMGISGNIEIYENPAIQSPIADDAISALENLGYKKFDCQKIINLLLKENSDITLESLITKTLQRLSK
ncbi:MAG: Holliday junction branch migration protein RuvA [Rickettsiales bacterium]|nr:Holliday junction branch migration protein RuvA [Rickettsiales bacterium]